MDVISLTRKLLSFKTMDPPGNELEIARFTGDLLSSHGFIVRHPLFRRNRLNLIAEKGLSGDKPPIVFSGHFDTVQANIKKWSVDPFAGLVINDRIWGLGSCDMKGGLAAIAYEACGVKRHMTGYPKALPYLTDGAVLQHFYKGAPTLIIGPGQPEVAHKTDEFCELGELERSVSIYRNIILKWGNQ